MLIFSKSSLKHPSAERILERLRVNNRITVSQKGEVILSSEERMRLDEAYSNYAERINDFQNQLNSLITDYSLECSTISLFNVVKSFFENNFNTDLIEISDDVDIEETDELHILFSEMIPINKQIINNKQKRAAQ